MKLKTLRTGRGLTQAVLAKKMKMKQAYVAQLESGAEANPTLATLRRLAKALEIEVGVFFQPGGAGVAKLTEAERKWNGEVEAEASKLRDVERWALELEKWGNTKKDWHSAMEAAKLAGLLHQAVAVAYDLQYFRDKEDEANWKKGQRIK